MAGVTQWNPWGWWTLCDNPCDSGTRTRTRTCIIPSRGLYGGLKKCHYGGMQTQNCSESVQPGGL